MPRYEKRGQGAWRQSSTIGASLEATAIERYRGHEVASSIALEEKKHYDGRTRSLTFTFGVEDCR